MEDEGEMKIGTFDQDLKAEIDEKQRLIDHCYAWLIGSEAHPDMIKWIVSRWYEEKWALVKRI